MGQDRYPVIRDGEEATAHHSDKVAASVARAVRALPGPRARLGPDRYHAALDQHAEHGRVAGQHADVPVQGLGDDDVGRDRPHLALPDHDPPHEAASATSPAYVTAL